jgi:hypothetical protein
MLYWAAALLPELDPVFGATPGRLPDGMNYADTLERVATSWRDAEIPFTHMLLDSFWYGEGVYNGASMWEDDAALMEAVQSFPKSLAAFSDAIGRDVSIWAHNGHFVASSPYTSRYPFKALMPQGPEMWRYLFAANAKAFQLRRIKQDHVGETIASVGTITDPDLIASWWGGMGVAAAESGISIEYCCSPPLVLSRRATYVPRTSSSHAKTQFCERQARSTSPAGATRSATRGAGPTRRDPFASTGVVKPSVPQSGADAAKSWVSAKRCPPDATT